MKATALHYDAHSTYSLRTSAFPGRSFMSFFISLSIFSISTSAKQWAFWVLWCNCFNYIYDHKNIFPNKNIWLRNLLLINEKYDVKRNYGWFETLTSNTTPLIINNFKLLLCHYIKSLPEFYELGSYWLVVLSSLENMSTNWLTILAWHILISSCSAFSLTKWLCTTMYSVQSEHEIMVFGSSVLLIDYHDAILN